MIPYRHMINPALGGSDLTNDYLDTLGLVEFAR